MFSALIVASVLSVGEIPPHFGAPLACQRPNNRAFTAVPSIDVAADGRMWATWFAKVRCSFSSMHQTCARTNCKWRT